jgi:hypothetical protein
VHVGTSKNNSSIPLNKGAEVSPVCKKLGDASGSVLSGVKLWHLTFQYFRLSALSLGIGQA